MLLILLIALFLLVRSNWGQNWLANQVANKLSTELKSKIKINHISISLFNRMGIKGILIEDRQRDTLLYAGSINVRISDWFFLKDKAELKYIGLEDAVIKLQRSDSVWNYQFLTDYFTPSTSDKKAKTGIQFDLKKMELKNVSVLQRDEWTGRDLTAKIGKLTLDTKEGFLTKKILDINELKIVDPFISIYDYPGKKPKSKSSPIVVTNIITLLDSTLQWNNAGWIVKAAKIDIINGVFKNDRKTTRTPYTYFDGNHFEFKKINLHLRDALWSKDTITSKLNLKAIERSGFEAKLLIADFKIHPKGMEFQNLELRTNKSVLKNRFAMKYNDFNDMGDFIHKVKIEANFSGADINSDDIAFFAPELKTWKKKIKIEGKVEGTVDDLKSENLVLIAGNGTLFKGAVSMTGLPDINHTFIDINAREFKTTYTDALKFVPSLRKVTYPNLMKLQYVNFQGNLTGFVRDFVTFGTIQTNLGIVKADLNLKIPANKDPVYSGSLSGSHFQLGQFINNSQVGILSFDATIKGRGFKFKTLATDFNAHIKELGFNGYVYQNITTNGSFDKRQFDGHFSIDDPNAEMSLNGTIDFKAETPTYNFIAEVKKAGLKNLNLTKEEMAFTGKFNLDFIGNNIDDFLGSARVTDASLFKNEQRLSFDSLIVSSSLSNGVKKIKVLSNEIDASITGDFNIQELPDNFMLFLNKYYPAYIKQPGNSLKNEAFTFDIKTGAIDEYLKLINNKLGGLNYSHVSGSLDLAKNLLMLDATVPEFSYNQYVFSNIKLKGDGNFDRFILTGELDNVVISDSINLPRTKFKIESRNDISQVNISANSNLAINNATIDAEVQTFFDGVKIKFHPSNFVLNGKTWTIEKDGEMQLRKNTASSGEVVLNENSQEIRIKSIPSDEGSWNDLQVVLKDLNMGDLSPLLMKTPILEGLVSGTILVQDPNGQMKLFADIKTDQLRIDNDSIGQVVSTLTYNNRTGNLIAKGFNLDPLHKIDFDLNLFLKDSLQEKNLISARFQRFQIKILDRFLGVLFSDLQGYLTGNLKISGAFDKLNIVGKGRLHDAGLKVNFTQCFYKIEDTDIELKTNSIELGTLKLLDRFGKTATVYGSIKHESFNKMIFDIHAKIDGQPFEALNTRFVDNKQFYGNAKGVGTLSFTGPESNMFLKLDIKASEQDSSYITIPSAASRESGIADFLVERKYGREMSGKDIKSGESNITYDADLTANQMVNIKIIMDELTGDEIKGRGDGTLKIRAGTTEPLTIRGRYNITDGNYLFTFQSFFKRDFEVVKNADNFIEWSGDPYKARINFYAKYKADNVSFAPLVKSLNLESNYANLRDDVYIVAHLYNELFDPRFKFKLEFPPSSPANTDPTLSFSIQQIENNPNEINKQVTYLIVFNSFANPENNNLSSSTLSEFASTTISGILSGEINKQLTKIFSKIFKNNEDFQFNFSGSFYNRNPLDVNNKNGFNMNQANLNVSVGQSFFNDRFVLTFGSGFDVPLQTGSTSGTQQLNFQFLPDVTAEWLINKAGSIRANFFYRENIDYLTGGSIGSSARNRRSGASIVYRKDFNSLKDLFSQNKKEESTVKKNEAVIENEEK